MSDKNLDLTRETPQAETKRAAVTRFFKNLFTKNVGLKVLAFVFSLLLWGYVLTDQKPLRTMVINEVATTFDGEAELLAKGLCVRGNREEILKKVSVTVRTQITNHPYMKPSNVSAVINLKNISQARPFTLPITASMASALGVVQSVSPNVIELDIDSLVTKSIPVSTIYQGEVPVGYWADMTAATTSNRIDIQGPRTDVSRVVRAECHVDLSEQTGTIYSTYDVELYDIEGNRVDADFLIGTLPTCTVRVPIYPAKIVPIDVMSSLIGTDNLAANHVVYNAVATPMEVRLVGTEAALDGIDFVTLEPISVSGLAAATTVTADIIVPEGVRVPEIAPVTVNIDVRESVLSKEFTKLPIHVTGLDNGLNAALDIETADIFVEGRYSLLGTLDRRNIHLFVDVTGLGVGVHTLPISQLVVDESATIELTTKLSCETVEVTITE